MRYGLPWLALVVFIGFLSGCGTAAPGVPTQREGNTSDAGRSGTVLPPGAPGSGRGASTAVPAPLAANSSELTVYAATSLTAPFTELGQQFENANNAKVTFSFGGSQQLAQQIKQGAPADVFASANQRQMDVVIDAGRVARGAEQIFARNRLVVIYPKDNPAKLAQLPDLARAGVKLVLAANAVPVGEYTRSFLAKASRLPQYTTAYEENVVRNVVSYEENVKVVLTKVALGEADAGIVYSSDVTPRVTDSVGRIEIPDELNTVAAYPIAAVADAANAGLARQFIDYVLSAEGQAVLLKYGFIVRETAHYSGAIAVNQR